jgi:phosphinothricin acetyltransferase
MTDEIVILDATDSDFAEIQRIYAHYVEKTTISLEEIPPSVDEMKARWKNSVEKNLPYLVAKVDGKVAGYAYAFPYRARSAYRFTVEESVYLSPEFQGQGIAQKLLGELISQCRAKGYKRMLAVVAGDDNLASIKFHEKMGFRKSGVLEKFGFKFNKWVDTILMQMDL